MTSQVFPQAAAGDYFNKTFVNAKYDAEKGEGVTVAKTYRVTAYPTFLILNSKGEEVGRLLGRGKDHGRFYSPGSKRNSKISGSKRDTAIAAVIAPYLCFRRALSITDGIIDKGLLHSWQPFNLWRICIVVRLYNICYNS